MGRAQHPANEWEIEIVVIHDAVITARQRETVRHEWEGSSPARQARDYVDVDGRDGTVARARLPDTQLGQVVDDHVTSLWAVLRVAGVGVFGDRPSEIRLHRRDRQ